MFNMASEEISFHDNAILNRIFNPNLPDEKANLPEPSEDVTENEPDSREVTESKRLEVEGVQAAEKGDLDSALEYFNQAISLSPERGSSYNNRAQLFRLQGKVQDALADLNCAIELSAGKGKVACQAYTQRGLIERLEGREENSLNDFKKAANLGSQFAKQQVIAMNPYAAMCNAMLSEVIGRLKTGEEVDD